MNTSNPGSHNTQTPNINSFHNGSVIPTMPSNNGPMSYVNNQVPPASRNHLTHLLTQPSSFPDAKQQSQSQPQSNVIGSTTGSQRIAMSVSSGQPMTSSIEYVSDTGMGMQQINSNRMVSSQHLQHQQISNQSGMMDMQNLPQHNQPALQMQDMTMVNGISHVPPNTGGGMINSFDSNVINHHGQQRMTMPSQPPRHMSNPNMLNQGQAQMMPASNLPQQQPMVQFTSPPQQPGFTSESQPQMPVNSFTQQGAPSHQTFVPGSQVNSSSVPNIGSDTKPPDTTSADKQKLIQQQLKLLLHATRCLQLDQESSNCPPHCPQMRAVITHMTTCSLGKNCLEPHCASSRQIISHFKSCNNPLCPVCQPLKTRTSAVRQQQQQQAQQQQQQVLHQQQQQQQCAPDQLGQNAVPHQVNMMHNRPPDYPPNMTNGNANVQPQNIPGPASNYKVVPQTMGLPNANDPFAINGITQHDTTGTYQGWREQVRPGHRQHLVRRIVQTIFPSRDINAYKDPRMAGLIDYAKKVEREMFQHAKSMDEYFQLLAEKCHKIHKELSEKRRSRQAPNAADCSRNSNTASGTASNPPLIAQIPPAPLTSQCGSTENLELGSSVPPNQGMAELSTAQQDSDAVNISKFDQYLHHEYNRHNQTNGELANSSTNLDSSFKPSVESSEFKSECFLNPPISSVSTNATMDVTCSTANSSSVVSFNASLDSGGSSTDIKVEPKISPSPAAPLSAENTPKCVSSGKNGLIIKEEPTTDDTPATPNSGASQSAATPATPSTADTKSGIVVKQEVECKNVRVWTREELLRYFLPLYKELYEKEDSAVFREPVDADKLGIPDYHKVISNPIDLSTIKKKLEDGEYKSPWAVVDDFWLMFNNAWLYNKKSTKIYRITTKVSEIFESLIDPLMQNLGFCCGREFVYMPQILYCSSPQTCSIVKEAVYFEYDNSKKDIPNLMCEKYLYCDKCYNEAGDEAAVVSDDPSQQYIMIQKSLFTKKKNNKKEPETFCTCKECGRKWHQVCACHMDEIWTEGFVCSTCLKQANGKRRENRYMAKRMPNTKLSNYLENRVNNFLKRKDVSTGEVTIRVLSSSDKKVDVKQHMRSRFTEIGEMAEAFPYRLKAIFAYQEIDGHDVCFFGLHVQEYGSECAEPNKRRVYISYLDSVFFFRPKEYRTDVYHEILVGYLSYVKHLGYTMAHIWACPPGEGDDYIFHMHPAEQKIPKPKRLQEWYQKVLEKSRSEGTVVDFRDILRDAIETKMVSATEIPYFEGDFWPNALEEIFKEIDAEEKKRKQEEAQVEEDEGSDCEKLDGNKVCDKKKAKKRKGNSRMGINSKRKKSNGPLDAGDELSRRVYEMMDKNKDMFFVIRLIAQNIAVSLQKIEDPDPLIQSELMDGRDSFLQLARDRHLEFSSLRRAKFSTMVMLYELHTENRRDFLYTCNNCNKNIETRYHCDTCEEFDLCATCYQNNTHPHELKRVANGFDDNDDSNDSNSNMQESRRSSLEKFVKVMAHSSHCRDVNCRMQNCYKMKQWMSHFKKCKNKTNKKCDLCKRILFLIFYHAKTCNLMAKCDVPLCKNIKENMRQQQARQQRAAVHLLRRRMANMHTVNHPQPVQNTVQQPTVNPNSAMVPVQNNTSAPSMGSYQMLPAQAIQQQPQQQQHQFGQQQQQQPQYFPQSQQSSQQGLINPQTSIGMTSSSYCPPPSYGPVDIQSQQHSGPGYQRFHNPGAASYNSQPMSKTLPPPHIQNQAPGMQHSLGMNSQQVGGLQMPRGHQPMTATPGGQAMPQQQPPQAMIPNAHQKEEMIKVQQVLVNIRSTFHDPAEQAKKMREWLQNNEEYLTAYKMLAAQQQQRNNNANNVAQQQVRGIINSVPNQNQPAQQHIGGGGPVPVPQHMGGSQVQQQMMGVGVSQQQVQTHIGAAPQQQWMLQQQQQHQRFRAQQPSNMSQPGQMMVPGTYPANAGNGSRGPVGPMMMAPRQQTLPSANMTFSGRPMHPMGATQPPGLPGGGPGMVAQQQQQQQNMYQPITDIVDPNVRTDQRMGPYDKM